MKRVLMLGPVPPPYGGIASVMEAIMNSELSKEYSFDVFERSAFSATLSKFKRNLFRVKRFIKFFQRCRLGKYDFVHIHSADPVFMGTIVFMLLARICRNRILLHMHGTDWEDFYSKNSQLTKLLIKLGLKLPTYIVVLYSLWADNIKKLCPNARLFVVRNLVHRSRPPDANKLIELRENLSLEDNSFVVLTVGTVGHRKGSFDILKAVPQVIKSKPSVRFVFVGGEEQTGEMDQLKKILQEEELGKWIKLVGEIRREDIPKFMAIADVFLLPSYIEGMPMAIIEAMQVGLPVISTRVGGIPEMVEDGKSGILINPGAPSEIANAVLYLMQDPEIRQKFGQRSKQIFEEKFEFSKGIKEVMHLYEML